MNEVYRLVLHHFILDGDGERHKLDEPLVVQMIVDRTHGNNSYSLNRMMDMMRHELLKEDGE